MLSAFRDWRSEICGEVRMRLAQIAAGSHLEFV